MKTGRRLLPRLGRHLRLPVAAGAAADRGPRRRNLPLPTHRRASRRPMSRARFGLPGKGRWPWAPTPTWRWWTWRRAPRWARHDLHYRHATAPTSAAHCGGRSCARSCAGTTVYHDGTIARVSRRLGRLAAARTRTSPARDLGGYGHVADLSATHDAWMTLLDLLERTPGRRASSRAAPTCSSSCSAACGRPTTLIDITAVARAEVRARRRASCIAAGRAGHPQRCARLAGRASSGRCRWRRRAARSARRRSARAPPSPAT